MKIKQKNLFKTFLLIGMCVMFVQLATPALAQDPDLGISQDVPDTLIQEGAEDAITADGSYGLEEQDYWAAAMEFSPDPGDSWEYQLFAFYGSPNGAKVRKQIELPWGARMTILECFFKDTSASNGSVVLYRNEQGPYAALNQTLNNIALATVSTSGSGGYYYPYIYLNEITQFRNGDKRNFYYLSATMPPTTTVQLRGCRIFWNRVVRTGLVNPFDDIGYLNSRFQNSIIAMAASGITRGCDFNSFCPEDVVTRGQMAVFLAEALGLHWPY